MSRSQHSHQTIRVGIPRWFGVVALAYLLVSVEVSVTVDARAPPVPLIVEVIRSAGLCTDNTSLYARMHTFFSLRTSHVNTRVAQGLRA